VECGYGQAVGVGGEELDGHECCVGCTSERVDAVYNRAYIYKLEQSPSHRSRSVNRSDLVPQRTASHIGKVMAHFSAESYFATQPAPPNLEECVSGVRNFIDRHSQGGKRIVLVTVRGGTPSRPMPPSYDVDFV